MDQGQALFQFSNRLSSRFRRYLQIVFNQRLVERPDCPA
jgi:hypothetical protein